MKVEIPAGTYCEPCDYKPADQERNLATTYDDSYGVYMGWAEITFSCEDCENDKQNAYEQE